MDLDKTVYPAWADERAARSPLGWNCLRAFVCGGAICVFAQGLNDLYAKADLPEETVKTLVSVTLIFLSALFTGLGLFDRIAKFAGAGTLVPITGFANAVVSPALDTRAEGYILGVGAKIFTVAGPVILYGCLASVCYGLLLFIARLLL